MWFGTVLLFKSSYNRSMAFCCSVLVSVVVGMCSGSFGTGFSGFGSGSRFFNSARRASCFLIKLAIMRSQYAWQRALVFLTRFSGIRIGSVVPSGRNTATVPVLVWLKPTNRPLTGMGI